MRAIYSDSALADLKNILTYTAENFPYQLTSLKQQIGAVVERIEMWPQSARIVSNSDGVRVVPLLRYPFKIFYVVEADQIVLLHIYHVAQNSG